MSERNKTNIAASKSMRQGLSDVPLEHGPTDGSYSMRNCQTICSLAKCSMHSELHHPETGKTYLRTQTGIVSTASPVVIRAR